MDVAGQERCGVDYVTAHASRKACHTAGVTPEHVPKFAISYARKRADDAALNY
jgi:hypothetical protein